MRGRWRAGVALLVAGAIGLATAPGAAQGLAAGGEGPVSVQIPEPPPSFQFEVSPKALPSGEPGAATLKFGIEEELSAAGQDGISVATIGLDRSIGLDPLGLPACRWPALESHIQVELTRPAECPHAIVGHAEVAILLADPDSKSLVLSSRGKVYNGGVRRGATRLMVELPLGPPMGQDLDLIVLVHHASEGRIGSEATIKIPAIAAGSAHLFELQLELGRSFMRDGERVAYVGAECRDGKLLASWSVLLTDGTKARSEVTRACTRQ